MPVPRSKRLFLIPAAILLVLVAVCIYFYFDPSDSALFPKCTFYTLTGWECPGCGSQRSIHALLHGDFVSAWHYNAMMIVALPVIILLCVGECLRARYPRFYLKINSRWMIWGTFIVVAGWWIGRNIF